MAANEAEFLYLTLYLHILLFVGVLRFLALSHLALKLPICLPEISIIFFLIVVTTKGVISSTNILACATNFKFFSTITIIYSSSDLVKRLTIFLTLVDLTLLNSVPNSNALFPYTILIFVLPKSL